MTAYLTAAEAGERIRMSTEYVRRQCHAGRIQAVRLGTEWRISEAALDAFMSAGDEPVPSPRKRLTARQARRSA